MTSRSRAWETKLVKAELDFQIDGKPAAFLPLVKNRDEGNVAPLQIYLIECAVRVGENWRTCEKIGLTLCQWHDYLRVNNVSIFDADEEHLRSFLLGGGVRYSNVRSIRKEVVATLNSTNRAKLSTIIAFYDFWERVRGVQLRSYRNTTIARLNEELFTRVNRSISRAKISFSRAAASKSSRQTGTPSQSDSERLLNRVLEQCNFNRAQTWYFIGSLAVYSGSRGVGIASLTIQELLKGIANEKEFRQQKNYKSILKNFQTSENRIAITSVLEHMLSLKRKFIYCNVRSKGGEWGPIALPIALAIELLDYICTTRAEFIAQRHSLNKLTPSDNVFLSNKFRTGTGVLQSESMGNYFNPLMRELEIDGTFHRLRAAFCEQVIRDIYIRERAVNGRAWQVNNVLEFARKLLGHKNTKSLHSYLNNVLAQEVLFGDPVTVEATEDTPFVRGICAALCGPNQHDFREQLRAFLSQNDIAPIHEEGRRYSLF